jgi:hypothetical protein
MNTIKNQFDNLLTSLTDGQFWQAMDQIQELSKALTSSTDENDWSIGETEGEFMLGDFIIGAWFWLADNHEGQSCKTYAALSAINSLVVVKQDEMNESEQDAYDFIQGSRDAEDDEAREEYERDMAELNSFDYDHVL